MPCVSEMSYGPHYVPSDDPALLFQNLGSFVRALHSGLRAYALHPRCRAHILVRQYDFDVCTIVYTYTFRRIS